METKEQLKKEHAKWTVKYTNAQKRHNDLLDSVLNLSKEKIPRVNITDLLAVFKDISAASKDMETAFTKMREIMEKLAQLR